MLMEGLQEKTRTSWPGETQAGERVAEEVTLSFLKVAKVRRDTPEGTRTWHPTKLSACLFQAPAEGRSRPQAVL